MIFHASISLIWAFIWLTDSMFSESKIDFVLILSLTNVPLQNLVILFWISCMFFRWSTQCDEVSISTLKAKIHLSFCIEMDDKNNIKWQFSNLYRFYLSFLYRWRKWPLYQLNKTINLSKKVDKFTVSNLAWYYCRSLDWSTS